MFKFHKKYAFVILSCLELVKLSSVSAQIYTLKFDSIRFAQTGDLTDDSGIGSVFMFESSSLDGVAGTGTGVYRVISDFDGDDLNDTFTFNLIATANSPGDSIGTNDAGYVGVGFHTF